MRGTIDSARGSGGFTLSELLIVVVILGLLQAIAIPKYMSTRTTDKARESVESGICTICELAVFQLNQATMSDDGEPNLAVNTDVVVSLARESDDTYSLKTDLYVSGALMDSFVTNAPGLKAGKHYPDFTDRWCRLVAKHLRQIEKKRAELMDLLANCPD